MGIRDDERPINANLPLKTWRRLRAMAFAETLPLGQIVADALELYIPTAEERRGKKYRGIPDDQNLPTGRPRKAK